MALTPSMMTALGTRCPPFALVDVVSSRRVRLADFAGQPLLVMFICNHCPYVVHIQSALGPLADDLAKRGVGVVGICSNDPTTHPADGPEPMARTAKAQGWTFPYLHDSDQSVARAFDAACTPDFFLYDAAHDLVYRGQFCPSRPGNGIPVTGSDLSAAVDAVLAGRAPQARQLPSIGCNIKWRASSP
ncbi:MAG: thioredoxin family protein [Phycisphaerales bacterium]|nr:thioredoxin family protein [Phycisphaerales bacterium]